MSKRKKKKLKDLFTMVGGFVLLNLLLIFLGGKHSKSFLEKYPNQPFKAALISLAFTSAIFAFVFFIWIPFKEWFKKTWSL